jgi:hypothetical protein
MHRQINPKVSVSIVFVAAMFMSIMDGTIVNVALPSIGRQLGIPSVLLDAVVVSYLAGWAIAGAPSASSCSPWRSSPSPQPCVGWRETSRSWCSSASCRVPQAGRLLRWEPPCSTGRSLPPNACIFPASSSSRPSSHPRQAPCLAVCW